MKMTQTPLTRLLIAAVVVVSLAVGFLVGRLSPSPAPAPAAAASDGNKTETKVLYWYDPMNPGQRFDRPGKSPFMDMDLVPRYANEAEEEDGVRISSRQQQNLGVRTAPVTRRSLSAPLTAYGTVAADARDIIAIPARGDGLIEKLYVSAPQQFVTEGSPLAQLWIPGWTAAQQEYLAVRRLGDPALTAAARQRLRLKLIPEAVIRDVDRSGEPQTRITLRAPHDGYATPQAIRAGSSVSATQTLFDLTKLDRVWIIVDYPEREAGALAVGSRVGAAAAGWPG
ncbi:efflux RND transporter periplasmic adaptor subunit, partial [Lonsdalea populi]